MYTSVCHLPTRQPPGKHPHLLGFGTELLSGDKSKDIYDGIVEPSALSRGAYWFHVHIMEPRAALVWVAGDGHW